MEPQIRPLYPETPLDAVEDLIQEKVIVEGRTFTIARPGGSDKLLDHPFVKEAFAADEYMPYWADLWPASRMLAKYIFREKWAPRLSALEIGCGLGLAGIAALAQGIRVTFSDYDATSIKFADANARANGFQNFTTLQLDWRFPPADLKAPLILGADLIYEVRNVEPIIALIEKVLQPEGQALIADQDRIPGEAFKKALDAGPFAYTTKVLHAGQPGGNRVKGTLYRILKRG